MLQNIYHTFFGNAGSDANGNLYSNSIDQQPLLIEDAIPLQRSDSADRTPKELCCPVTRLIYRNPVITLSSPNVTVEEDVLIHPNKYETGVPRKCTDIFSKRYVRNNAIANAVTRYLTKYPEKDSDEYRFPEYPELDHKTQRYIQLFASFVCIGGIIVGIVMIIIKLPPCDHIALRNSFPQPLNFTRTTSSDDDRFACILYPKALVYPNETTHIERSIANYECSFLTDNGLSIHTTAFRVYVQGETPDGLKMQAKHSKNEKCLWTLVEDNVQDSRNFRA